LKYSLLRILSNQLQTKNELKLEVDSQVQPSATETDETGETNNVNGQRDAASNTD